MAAKRSKTSALPPTTGATGNADAANETTQRAPNPLRRPEDLFAKQADALGDIAAHLNAALEAGCRSLGVQPGLVEIVASRLREAGWFVAVMPAQSAAQVNLLVCSEVDIPSWRAFVHKTASVTGSPQTAPQASLVPSAHAGASGASGASSTSSTSEAASSAAHASKSNGVAKTDAR